MSKGYEFFDHTADIGVRVYGATLADLFRNAAVAMYAALGSLAKTEERRKKSVEFKGAIIEDLLHDWLAELLYEVEANHILYDQIDSLNVTANADARATDAAPTFDLQATLRGGLIDFSQSQTNEEIKAVTYHELRVEQLPGAAWRATVIFDV